MKFIFFILLLSAFGFNSYSQAKPTIKLKCSSTFSDNPPLWVLLFRKKSYILNHSSASLVNPDTIEKLDVSKDAPTTAIYGVRAANGVIVVIIKKTESRKEYKRLKPYLERS